MIHYDFISYNLKFNHMLQVVKYFLILYYIIHWYCIIIWYNIMLYCKKIIIYHMISFNIMKHYWVIYLNFVLYVILCYMIHNHTLNSWNTSYFQALFLSELSLIARQCLIKMGIFLVIHTNLGKKSRKYLPPDLKQIRNTSNNKDRVLKLYRRKHY